MRGEKIILSQSQGSSFIIISVTLLMIITGSLLYWYRVPNETVPSSVYYEKKEESIVPKINPVDESFFRRLSNIFSSLFTD